MFRSIPRPAAQAYWCSKEPYAAKITTNRLIHGLWMTSASWANWVARYTAMGYQVVARSWPGMEGDIHELRRDPSAIATIGIADIVDHYEHIIRGLDEDPFIIGHSFGGLITRSCSTAASARQVWPSLRPRSRAFCSYLFPHSAYPFRP